MAILTDAPPARLERLETRLNCSRGLAIRFAMALWLPNLQNRYLELASSLRATDTRKTVDLAGRIHDAARIGDAREIVEAMETIAAYASRGRWDAAISRFREANHQLKEVTQYVSTLDRSSGEV